MQLTQEEQARLDELNEKEETQGAASMEPNEIAHQLYLLSKQGYKEEVKGQPGLVFNAKEQRTFFTNRELDRYRRPGTVQRRLFDAP